jgi:hypothetical protein
MTNEKNIKSWKHLVEELDKLEKSYGNLAKRFLYRGQANSTWTLETTMERSLKTPVSLSKYYLFAYSAKTMIETFTETTWDIPEPPNYNQWLKESNALSFQPFPAYNYLAYLRHHGFPSPFLDWSASPYIAIFFAFNNCPRNVKHVSLYAFLEYVGYGKGTSTDQPQICVLGPYVKVHRRHFLQQSQYTICVEFDENGAIYTDHERVTRKNDDKQDMLWKFNIPVTERARVLGELNRMNINSFSLFGSEDSLVETISTNEIIKREL